MYHINTDKIHHIFVDSLDTEEYRITLNICLGFIKFYLKRCLLEGVFIRGRAFTQSNTVLYEAGKSLVISALFPYKKSRVI